MSDRFAYIIQKQGAFSFSKLLEEMQRFGVGLTNPETNTPTRITAEGESLSVTQTDIEASIQSKQAVTIQFWIARGDDLVCALQHVDSFVGEWYSFSNPESNTD